MNYMRSVFSLSLCLIVLSLPLGAEPFGNLPFNIRFDTSVANLAANVFSTGPIRSAGPYNVFRAEVASSVAGTLAIQTSTTTNTSLFLDFATISVTSGVPTSLEIDLTAAYVRSIFRNGATAQTRFYHREVLQLWP